MSPLIYTLVPSVISIIMVRITFSLLPDEVMLVWTWQTLVCDIKLFLLIIIQRVYIAILDIKQNEKLTPKLIKC